MKGGARLGRRGIEGLSGQALLDRARAEMGPSRAERAALRRGVLAAVSAGTVAAVAGSAHAAVGTGASATSAVAHGVASAKAAAALGASTVAGATATTATTFTAAVTLKWTLAAVIATAAVAGTSVISVNTWRRHQHGREESAHTTSVHIASSNSAPHALRTPIDDLALTHDTLQVLEAPTATLADPRVTRQQTILDAADVAQSARSSLRRAPAREVEPTQQLAATEQPPPLPTAENDLAEETSLLRAAHTALSAGDSSLALSILDQHSLRFPSGTLMEERLALHARVLCDSGQTERGREEARRFAANHARSPQIARILRACGIAN